jgi:hypothetical protein
MLTQVWYLAWLAASYAPAAAAYCVYLCNPSYCREQQQKQLRQQALLLG